MQKTRQLPGVNEANSYRLVCTSKKRRMQLYSCSGMPIHTQLIETHFGSFATENILCVACPDFVLVWVTAGISARASGAARDHMEAKL